MKAVIHSVVVVLIEAAIQSEVAQNLVWAFSRGGGVIWLV